MVDTEKISEVKEVVYFPQETTIIPQSSVKSFSENLAKMYCVDVPEIKTIIDSSYTKEVVFTDNLVSTVGSTDLFAQFKSLRSLFADVKHTLTSVKVETIPVPHLKYYITERNQVTKKSC